MFNPISYQDGDSPFSTKHQLPSTHAIFRQLDINLSSIHPSIRHQFLMCLSPGIPLVDFAQISCQPSMEETPLKRP
jgi:hypothetical protein